MSGCWLADCDRRRLKRQLVISEYTITSTPIKTVTLVTDSRSASRPVMKIGTVAAMLTIILRAANTLPRWWSLVLSWRRVWAAVLIMAIRIPSISINTATIMLIADV
jgi:hypothetical protein